MKKIIATSAAIILLLTGCSSAPKDEPVEKAPEATVEAVETAPEPEETASAEGTASIGEPIVDGDWEITINSWTPDINAEVLAASGGEDVPAEGQQFALLNVTMKYLGEGLGDNSMVNVMYLPEGGNTASNLWEAFGTTPGENKLTFEELVSGGSITGDALYLIDAGTTGELWVLTPTAENPVIISL